MSKKVSDALEEELVQVKEELVQVREELAILKAVKEDEDGKLENTE